MSKVARIFLTVFLLITVATCTLDSRLGMSLEEWRSECRDTSAFRAFDMGRLAVKDGEDYEVYECVGELYIRKYYHFANKKLVKITPSPPSLEELQAKQRREP